MGAFWYTDITHKLATGALDLSTADIRAKLLMSNTTAGTDEDATNIAGITTLDEYDGSGYAEVDLASVTVTKQAATDRTELSADDGSFGSSVAAGSRPAVAVLFYVRIDGTAANDFPLIHDDTAANFPLTGDGSPVPLTLGGGLVGTIEG